MKSNHNSTLLLSLFILLFACSSTINSSAAAAAENLPFHAVLHGNANPVPTGDCTLTNTETGSGVALHLGKWNWSDQENVQFLSCPPPGSAISVSGSFKMVAANGDEIDGTFETAGTFSPASGVSVQGSYTFVSGTGRFVNVAGSGVISAHGGASPPFEFVGSLDGVIDYGRR